MEGSDKIVKVIILGESGVGKSGICMRFTSNVFESTTTATVGCDLATKKLTIDGVELRLALWDTAGQERFHSLSPSFYRDAHCAILVYDITNRKSFLQLDTWLDNVRCYSKNPILMVIGNKSDLEESREVTEKEGMNFAKSINSLFMETSAKNAANINKAFTELATKVLQTPNLLQPVDDALRLTPSDSFDKGSCALSRCYTWVTGGGPAQ